ncbi:MAG: hypothetical protein ACU0BV_12065, partial [Pseudophaeobacter sp.]
AGRGDPDPHRRTQPLYCAWHTRHRARRVNPSGVRGSLHIIRFVQQSLQDLPTPADQEEPFGLGAPWTHHANADELEELAKLHNWITRKQQALTRLIETRAAIRRRCVKRMRREAGKD